MESILSHDHLYSGTNLVNETAAKQFGIHCLPTDSAENIDRSPWWNDPFTIVSTIFLSIHFTAMTSGQITNYMVSDKKSLHWHVMKVHLMWLNSLTESVI